MQVNNLRKYRIAHHLSSDKLAGLMGVHPSTVYSWETGKSRPKLYQIRRMAALLECGEDELGLDAYDCRSYGKPLEDRRTSPEKRALYADFMLLSLDRQRRIAAYLGPDSYRTTVKRLRDGALTDGEAALVRDMMERERGRR